MHQPGGDELQAVMDRLTQQMRRAIMKALRDSGRDDFALTSHWKPDLPGIVHLFGKAYWWDRCPDGQLTLQRAAWLDGWGMK